MYDTYLLDLRCMIIIRVDISTISIIWLKWLRFWFIWSCLALYDIICSQLLVYTSLLLLFDHSFFVSG